MGVGAEGLPDAAQGDMEGAEIKGGIEEAVQTGVQEGQFFQEGGLAGLFLPALLQVKVTGEMLGVAAEGGGAEAELPGQGAVGHPLYEAAVDLRAGGVRADGTAHRLEVCATRACTINALQDRNFRMMPDGFQIIKGVEGGPARAGQLAEHILKPRERSAQIVIKCNDQDLS